MFCFRTKLVNHSQALHSQVIWSFCFFYTYWCSYFSQREVLSLHMLTASGKIELYWPDNMYVFNDEECGFHQCECYSNCPVQWQTHRCSLDGFSPSYLTANQVCCGSIRQKNLVISTHSILSLVPGSKALTPCTQYAWPRWESNLGFLNWRHLLSPFKKPSVATQTNVASTISVCPLSWSGVWGLVLVSWICVNRHRQSF